MLKHWQTHAEYQQFISETVALLHPSQLKKLYSMSDSWDKLTSLNLDPVGDFLAAFYSNTGRPALNQPQILRSFVLMLDRRFTSLTKWTGELKGDDLLAMLIGCSPDSLPPLGSYFDFINRLWLRNPDFEKSGRGDLFPAGKNKKPSSKPGKNKKLPNRHAGITERIADYALTERDFPFYYEKALQQLFSIASVVPSLELGLIVPDNLTVAGDGTCLHSHANPCGHKVCKCHEHGIYDCSCPRHYSDPDASWGWDSDLNSYFYGHTLYMLSYHNEQYQTDLPLHIRFFDARRHDSVSGIVTLAEFRKITPGLQIKNICMDSANDNYPTYELCKEWNIAPFIDLNSNRGRPESIPKNLSIDPDGTPLCAAGLRMVYWGYSPSAMIASGVVRSPVEKRKTVPAKSPAPLPPTGVAFIPDLIGISVFTLQSPEAPKNIKRLTITAQVQNE